MKKLYHAICLKATAAIPKITKNNQKKELRFGAYETYEKAREKKFLQQILQQTKLQHAAKRKNCSSF